MKNNGLKINDPSRKLGVKYLDDIQLTNSFPDWKALLARIEEQRQIAEFAAREQYEANEEHFPQTYDNLLAVLGGRGSGKSSVILTLREKMKYPVNQDILLPIITPEIISEQECSILGWIMSATETIIRDLEHRIENLNRNRHGNIRECGDNLDQFFKDCRFRKDNPLRQRYQDLFEKSVSTSGGVDTSGYSAEDAVSYRVKRSQKQYKLIQDLNDFWSELTNVWYLTRLRELGQEKNKSATQLSIKRPLIVLMFDDIDLVPERSMELLTTTFQYFTNPNIVIILTAAEQVLKDVIRLKMFERLIGSPSSSLLMDAVPWGHIRNTVHEWTMDQFDPSPVDKMSREFYDKVIPPSSRYRLRRYEIIEEKRLYAYSSMGQSFWIPQANTSYSIPIEQFLIDQVEKLRQAFVPDKGNVSNFLLGGKKEQVFQKAYLIVFGEKSRNIANGCLEIMNTFDRLTQLDAKGRELTAEEHQEVLLSLRHLVRALLLSKESLNEYADHVDSFLYPAPDRIGNYMDYNFALECYQKEQRKIHDWVISRQQKDNPISPERLPHVVADYLGKAQAKIAALMMVMFFAEGILMITDCRRHHIHGYRQLSTLLNSDVIIETDGAEYHTKNLPLFPEHQQTFEFLHSMPLVLEHIHHYVGMDLYNTRYASNYLSDIFQVRLSEEKTEPKTILKQAVNKEREWVKTVLTMLVIQHSGITLVEPAFLQIPEEELRRLNLFAFTAQYSRKKRLAALDFLTQGNLISACRCRMTDFQLLTQEEYDWTAITRRFKNTFLRPNCNSPLQHLDNQYDTFVESADPEQQYIKAYFSYRWKDYIAAETEGPEEQKESDSHFGQCYRLVRFVQNTLSAFVKALSNLTSLYLTQEQINKIRKYIQNIDDYNLELKLKKEALITRLDRTMLAMGLNTEEQDGQFTMDTPSGKDNKHLQIPARPFIEYLVELQKTVQEQQSELSTYDYYERVVYREYFQLTSYLIVAYENPQETAEIGGVSIPMSSMLISELKMLEFLFPYYFAAHMGIVEDSRYQSELPASAYAPNDSVKAKLYTLFEQLTRGKPTAKSDKSLLDLMKEVQRELAIRYCDYLESPYE